MSEHQGSMFIPESFGKKSAQKNKGVTEIIATRSRLISNDILNSPEVISRKKMISDRLEEISSTQSTDNQLLLPF